MSHSVDEMLARARRRIRRFGPQELEPIAASGGLIVDIRPSEQRTQEGELPLAVVLERNVLEWRLDPASTHRIPEVKGYELPIVVVCSEGYASSLAAATLVDLGHVKAGDLIGGFKAWRIWSEAGRSPSDGRSQWESPDHTIA